MIRDFPSPLALHEASHCAALLLAGLTPTWARIDKPGKGVAGAVKSDWDAWDLATDARAVLTAVLMGPIFSGLLIDDWPINPDDPRWADEGCEWDAEAARALAEHLRFDRVDWSWLVWQAKQLARSPEFRRIVLRLAQALDDRDVLDGQQLQQIYDRESAMCAAA